jgi:hypothetical protein
MTSSTVSCSLAIKGRKELLANYGRMDRALVIAHSDIVAFVRDRKLHGRGVGWIDVHLLASPLVCRLKLWTTNPALATLAKELGISYD